MDKVFIVAMLAIPIIHFCVFWIYVNINSILMAFQLPTGEWSMETYKAVFRDFSGGSSSSTLLIAIKNTLIYFTKDLVMMAFHILIAYFLYRRVFGYRAFQIIFYLPSIVSGVAIAAAFQNFIIPDGPLGILLSKMGVEELPNLLANSDYATPTIVFYTVWLGWGGQMLLLGGALARVPIEILESARLDGITTPREIVSMILPLIWPTVSTLLILQCTGIFSAGGPILLFTKGGFKTATIGYWIFDKVAYAGASAYNEVAAVGLLFTVVGVPVIMLIRWLIERIPVAEY